MKATTRSLARCILGMCALALVCGGSTALASKCTDCQTKCQTKAAACEAAKKKGCGKKANECLTACKVSSGCP